MKRRCISQEHVAQVLAAPEQAWEVRRGRRVNQSRLTTADAGKVHLLRVFVDIDQCPAAVVTVYRTSKLLKDWR